MPNNMGAMMGGGIKKVNPGSGQTMSDDQLIAKMLTGRKAHRQLDKKKQVFITEMS